MPHKETLSQIHTWLLAHFPHAKTTCLGIDGSLLDSGIVDSLGTLDIVMFLETEFGLVVNDEDMVADHFETVLSIAKFVESKLAMDPLAL